VRNVKILVTVATSVGRNWVIAVFCPICCLFKSIKEIAVRAEIPINYLFSVLLQYCGYYYGDIITFRVIEVLLF